MHSHLFVTIYRYSYPLFNRVLDSVFLHLLLLLETVMKTQSISDCHLQWYFKMLKSKSSAENALNKV